MSSNESNQSSPDELTKAAEQLAMVAVHSRLLRDMRKEAGIEEYLDPVLKSVKGFGNQAAESAKNYGGQAVDAVKGLGTTDGWRNLGNQAMDLAKKYPEPLIGAGVGATVGGGTALMNKRKRRNFLSSALTGALAGGLGGTGVHMLRNGGKNRLLTSLGIDPEIQVPHLSGGVDENGEPLTETVLGARGVEDYADKVQRTGAAASTSGRLRDIGLPLVVGAADATWNANQLATSMRHPYTTQRSMFSPFGAHGASDFQKGLGEISDDKVLRRVMQDLTGRDMAGTRQQLQDFARLNPKELQRALKPAFKDPVTDKLLRRVMEAGREARLSSAAGGGKTLGGFFRRNARPAGHIGGRLGLYGGVYALLNHLANQSGDEQRRQWAQQVQHSGVIKGLQ